MAGNIVMNSFTITEAGELFLEQPHAIKIPRPPGTHIINPHVQYSTYICTL